MENTKQGNLRDRWWSVLPMPESITQSPRCCPAGSPAAFRPAAPRPSGQAAPPPARGRRPRRGEGVGHPWRAVGGAAALHGEGVPLPSTKEAHQPCLRAGGLGDTFAGSTRTPSPHPLPCRYQYYATINSERLPPLRGGIAIMRKKRPRQHCRRSRSGRSGDGQPTAALCARPSPGAPGLSILPPLWG
jgi:hypothetical protein